MKAFCTLFIFLFLASNSNSQEQTVYITKTGEKYHKSTCRHLKYSKREITLQQALDAGYKACLVCKPTKGVTQESTQNTSLSIAPKSTNTKTTTTTDQAKTTTSTQCTGKTKAGNRCKRMTKSANGRCHQH